MNKKLVFLSIIVLVSAFFIQCGKDCAKEECPNIKPASFSFRLLNNANQDLLVGSAKMYETTQVIIKSKKTSGSSFETVNSYFTLINDSSILGSFTVDKSYYMYYLQLNNAITDSMAFGFNSRFSGCCDLSNYYLSKFNTTSISDWGLPGTYFIRK